MANDLDNRDNLDSVHIDDTEKIMTNNRVICKYCAQEVLVTTRGKLSLHDRRNGTDLTRCIGSLLLVHEGGVKAGEQPLVQDVLLAKRVPVNYQYHQLNWDFIHGMAAVAMYASEKYGSVQQYANSRLLGEKSPMNHLLDHYRQYVTGQPHDHFNTIEAHLVAIAYNAMMEYFYFQKFGPEEYRLHVDQS
jgi:hypothetical protein